MIWRVFCAVCAATSFATAVLNLITDDPDDSAGWIALAWVYAQEAAK